MVIEYCSLKYTNSLHTLRLFKQGFWLICNTLDWLYNYRWAAGINKLTKLDILLSGGMDRWEYHILFWDKFILHDKNKLCVWIEKKQLYIKTMILLHMYISSYYITHPWPSQCLPLSIIVHIQQVKHFQTEWQTVGTVNYSRFGCHHIQMGRGPALRLALKDHRACHREVGKANLLPLSVCP